MQWPPLTTKKKKSDQKPVKVELPIPKRKKHVPPGRTSRCIVVNGIVIARRNGPEGDVHSVLQTGKQKSNGKKNEKKTRREKVKKIRENESS
jgi:hypothetical protein